MRSGLLVACLALSACNASTGVQIEITPPPGQAVDTVRVYVGTGSGKHTVMTPPGFAAPLAARKGSYWTRDSTQYQDRAQLSGESEVKFVFETAGTDKITVIAVGFTNGVPTATAALFEEEVTAGAFEVWNLALAPATPARPNVAAPRQVQVWANDECVYAVDEAQPDGSVRHAYMGVAEDDKDCDGWIDQAADKAECDDTWHDATKAPAQNTLDCMEPQKITGVGGVQYEGCLLGSPRCIDGRPELTEACNHDRPYCAPSNLCTLCAGSDARASLECALGKLEDEGTLRIVCDVQTYLGGSGYELCEQTLLMNPTLANQTRACSLRAPMFLGTASDSTWTTAPDVGGITMTMNVPLQSCDLTASPTSASGTIERPSDFPVAGLLAIDLEPSHGAVVPVIFQLVKRTTPCEPNLPVQCRIADGLNGVEHFGSCISDAPATPR